MDALRVMSFNVRGSFRDLGRRNAWPNRARVNVAAIARHAPDLVGFQECQRGNLAAYGKHLPRLRHIKGPEYGNTPPYDFNAILFDPARLELVRSGGFWLSETPRRRSRGWEARVARSANWALFGSESGPLLHLNTHLDHKSARARRNGGALIVREVEALLENFGPETPTLLTGDFNCRPGTPTYETFEAAGFVDTFLAAGNTDEAEANTFHAFEGRGYRDPRPKLGPRRIDWVLLKDPAGRFRIVAHDILTAEGPPFPSDHHPILATFAHPGRVQSG